MSKRKSITIRPAHLCDINHLKPIWLEFMEYHAGLDAKYRFYPEDWHQVFQRFAQALQTEHYRLLVAGKKETIIGYVFGFIFTNYPGYYPRQIGFINDLMVTKAWQQQGVGGQLVQAMEKWFKERGIEVMQLYVATRNDPGKNFWRACGYEPFLVGMWKELPP